MRQASGSGYAMHYFTADHLGSTRLVTDASGSVREQFDYLPFGELCQNSGLAIANQAKTDYLYTGKELQQFFGINWYDKKKAIFHREIKFLDKMKIIISTIFSSPMDPNHPARNKLKSFSRDYLNDYFCNKDYGKDVQEIEIHVHMISSRFYPGCKISRPRYYDLYTQPKSNICLAEPETWVKRFAIDTLVSEEDFEALLIANKDEIDAILARHIFKSLNQLDKLPKRLKDFDKEGFKRDVEALFRSHGWL